MEHLIPEAWFHGMAQWMLLAIGAFAVVALAKGADWLVEGASSIAYRVGMPKVIVGATIVSLGTTSPEAAVSVMAAWQGQPGLALGNAVGSIIADSALIFGLGCLLVSLPADRFVLSRQGWVQFGSAVLLAALCYGSVFVAGDAAQLGRWVGLLLVVCLVAYMIISVRWSRQHSFGEPGQLHELREVDHDPLWVSGVRIVLGLLFVIVASHVMIQCVRELATEHWHVPSVVISSTLVAFGTSLPELVIGMASIYKGHKEILVGNVIGADILNVLFVVGASASAAPLPLYDQSSKIPGIFLVLHLPAMLLVLVLFRIFIHRAVGRGHFSRWYGVPLLVLYVAYTVAQYVVS